MTLQKASKMLNTSSSSYMTNPLLLIVLMLIGLIIILSIFRSSSESLTLGFGINAHIGDLRSSFELETFSGQEKGQGQGQGQGQEMPTFVMYYAEWCGHCKRTKPEFKKLMDQNENKRVKLLMIDAEVPENKDLVSSQNIKGFPTIRYYPTGISDNYDEYSGDRDLQSFASYLEGK